MSENTQSAEQYYDSYKLILGVVEQVRKYVSGNLGWIAKQDKLDNDETFGFVIGNRFGTVTLTEARSADDALIRRIATEMMGYAPGSVEDLRQQLEEARVIVEEAERQKLAAERHFDWWQQRVEMLERELTAKENA